MKTNRYLILITFLGIMLACGKPSLKRYSPHTTFPRAVYVENQIQKIQTTKMTSSKTPLYVDISLYNGKKESGKLIQISENYVEVSRGYYYQRGKDKKVEVKEDVMLVPKGEILIMKIW